MEHQDLSHTVHQLSQQLNSLAAENQHLRHMIQSNGNHSAPEPKVMLPEKFSGKHSDLRNFISAISNVVELQPIRYRSDRAKTGLVGSLCSGDALSWYRSIQESRPEILLDWNQFNIELKDHFGDPYFIENARRQLLSLNQGRSSASTFASRFRRVAGDAGFNDETLQYHFERGLNPEVRRAIAINNQSFESLDELMKYSIRVDNRLFEAQRLDSSVVRPYAPVSSGPTPMEIGLVSSTPSTKFRKLSDEEKADRRRKGLCLYCGQAGHLAHVCPAKQQTSHRVAATVPITKND